MTSPSKIRSLLGAMLALTLPLGAALAADETRPAQWKLATTARTRVEFYDFFDPGNVPVGRQNEYVFVGNLVKFDISKKTKNRDTLFELASPSLLFLPTDAVAPGAQGQLGLGATYRVSNRGQDASIFVKQAYVSFHDLDDHHLGIKLGRFDFVEGQEILTGDPVLDVLKRDRIAHRLIGNFGFTHVQRSFDGLVVTRDAGKHQTTVMAARPTIGVFDLDGMESLEDVRVAYGALNFRLKSEHADGRLFLIDYDDSRDGIVKVDNRAVRARQLDLENIHVMTLGGHYIKRWRDWDGLAWGVLQGGDWGVQEHSAWSFALEAGRQWPRQTWKPWLRVGLNRSSGDDNPTDGKHRTFFEVLPTPRIYARYPFYNLMNLTDAFVSLTLRPHRKVSVRADYHNLDLTEARDLWYAAGGAFDRRFFGFAGRPSGGFDELGDLVDASIDWKLDDRTSLTLYHAQMFGGDVTEFTFPQGKDAAFGYIEVNHRF